jgi:hypothetical protein
MDIFIEWESDFPKGYGHTSIAFLKRCLGFEDAKNGDMDAAHFVVGRCVKQDRLQKLREQYPNAVLLPVLGNNKLPLALAQIIGLPIWLDVHLVHIVSRKLLCAIERFLHRPIFTGYIQGDLEYIIIDDVITQGGTISALRNYVISMGGVVVAVVALAYAIGSHAVAPIKRHLVRLLLKFGMTLMSFLKIYGIAVSTRALTNSQVKYLLRFASVGNILKKIAQPLNLKHYVIIDS